MSDIVWFSGSDADAPATPASTITFALVDEDGSGRFAIDPVTGVLATTGSLHYEDAASYMLEIVAHDSGDPQLTSTVALVAVNVEDENDSGPTTMEIEYTVTPPFFSEALPLGGVGTHVATIIANDPDVNSTVRYRIDASQADAGVAVDAVSGVVRITRALDAEVEAARILRVTAFDPACPACPSLSKQFTIFIKVRVRAIPGRVVGCVSATTVTITESFHP